MTIFYNFSGGMESAAMIAVEKERILDTGAIVRWANTGKQYPEMAASVAQIVRLLGISIIEVGRRITFDEFLFERGGILRKGLTDCSRRMKRSNLTRHMKSFSRPYEVNMGFNASEGKRAAEFIERNERDWLHWRFPLLERGIEREDTWKICRESGFEIIVAMYEKMGRFDCWFCPNQKPSQVRKLAEFYPELAKEWQEIEERKKNSILPAPFNVIVANAADWKGDTGCSCFGGTDSIADEIEAEA